MNTKTTSLKESNLLEWVKELEEQGKSAKCRQNSRKAMHKSLNKSAFHNSARDQWLSSCNKTQKKISTVHTAMISDSTVEVLSNTVTNASLEGSESVLRALQDKPADLKIKVLVDFKVVKGETKRLVNPVALPVTRILKNNKVQTKSGDVYTVVPWKTPTADFLAIE